MRKSRTRRSYLWRLERYSEGKKLAQEALRLKMSPRFPERMDHNGKPLVATNGTVEISVDDLHRFQVLAWFMSEYGEDW